MKRNNHSSSPKKNSLESKFNKNNMLVAVRARPLNKRELEESNYNTISISNRDTVTISIPLEYVPAEKGKKYLNREKDKKINITKIKEAMFKFDFAFDEKCDQAEIYKNTTSNLIKKVVDGFNATIFAYGATGSGKTYTMVGNSDNCGIMIRTIKDLFSIVNKDKEKKYIVKISYIEIYNEVIKDLLSSESKPPPLDLRTDPQKGVVIQGAEFKIVTNEVDAYKIILRGNKRRTEKATDFNESSSRSHALLQIYLEIQENVITFKNEFTFGKLILVDLAGSEKTSVNSKATTESGSINKSLLALGKCINALISQNKGYIPWRDSKLTRMLQESLSGNSRIVMIATISPSISCFDETMFTLQYANRSKNLKVNLKKNVLENNVRINKYDEYIQSLKEQIGEVDGQIVEQEKLNNSNVSAGGLVVEPEQVQMNTTNNNINTSGNNLNVNNNNKNVVNTNNVNNNIINNNILINNKNNVTNENSNYTRNDEYDKIKKDMVEHFQSEINLRKKIIERENLIEDLKNELSEQEYQMLHASKANTKTLRSKYEKKKNEIDEKKNKITKGYIKQNELMAKRREFQLVISKLTKADPQNAQVKILYNIYKYYLNLLENITTEHRKVLNLNEIKRKDKKISLLNEQLDLRDLYIRNAYRQLSMNNVEFNYKNPKLVSSDEIEIDPNHPQIIRISPSFDSLNEISKNQSPLKNSQNLNSYSEKKKDKSVSFNKKNKHTNTVENSSKIRKYKSNLLNREDKYKELTNIRQQILDNTKISKKRQFGNEILALFNYNPKYNPNNNPGLDLNLFERKISPNNKRNISNTLMNAGMNAMQYDSNNNVNNSRINQMSRPVVQNYVLKDINSVQKGQRIKNLRYDGNLMLHMSYDKKNNNRYRNKTNPNNYNNYNYYNNYNNYRNYNNYNNNYNNYNNISNLSISRDNSSNRSSSQIEITNTSALENEVQKKVKTILKKDYIGRYKRSPYLKLLE